MQDNQSPPIGSADVNASKASLTSLMATVAEYYNAIRQRRMIQATRAKARAGYAVRRPPTGYVADRRGQWLMDPDPAVRETIGKLFEDVERLGSIGKVVKHYQENGILLPVRTTDAVRMEPPSRGRIRAIITHLAYMGTYVFGRRVTVRGRSCRQGNADEVIVIPDHHAPYISPERWERIQGLLHRPNRSES